MIETFPPNAFRDALLAALQRLLRRLEDRPARQVLQQAIEKAGPNPSFFKLARKARAALAELEKNGFEGQETRETLSSFGNLKSPFFGILPPPSALRAPERQNAA